MDREAQQTDVPPQVAILEEAFHLQHQRGHPYGGIEDNFARAAVIASATTNIHLTPRDIALILASVKMARMAGDPLHHDNYVDGINYLAFADALTRREPGP